MNCPKCNYVFRKPEEFCSACGYKFDNHVFEKICFFFDMKNELEGVNLFKRNLQFKLDNIYNKFEGYEKLLADDIKMISDVESLQKELDDVKKQLRQPSPVEVDSEAHPPSVLADKPEAIEPEKTDIEEAETSPVEVKTESPVAEEPKSPVPEKVSGGIPDKAPGKPVKIKTKPAEASAFETNLWQKWMLIVGIVTMVFGIGYFLKYSFDKGWIGPAARVSLAYLWGIAFLVGGNQFRKKDYRLFGLYLVGGGIAVLYFSAFAAFQIYGLFTQVPSFAIMVLITILASSLAIFYNTRWLAVLGIVGGFLTPILMSTGHDRQIALMTYMAILNMGILFVAFYKQWTILNVLGFVFTFVLFSGWFFKFYDDSKFWPSILFLNLFYLIYSIAPIAYELRRAANKKFIEMAIILPNSFVSFAFCYYMVKNYASIEWVGVVTIIYSVLFLLMASYLFYKKQADRGVFAILVAKAMLFIIVTIPIIFSQHWITIFWASQAIALLWLGIRLGRRWFVVTAHVLMYMTVGKFILYDYIKVFKFGAHGLIFGNSYHYLILDRLVTSFLLLAALYGFYRILRAVCVSTTSEEESSKSSGTDAIFSMFLIVFFIILNMETVAFFSHYKTPARFAAISILWSLFAMWLVYLGGRRKQSLFSFFAKSLLCITVVKFILFDYAFVFDIAFEDYTYLIVERLLTSVLMLGVGYAFLHFVKKQIRTADSEINAKVARNEYVGFVISWIVLLFTILNVETAAFFAEYLEEAQFAAISILWALFSIGLVINGLRKKQSGFRWAALALFVATIIKVFMFDMAKFSTPYRILSFIVLGMLLIGASYLYHRFKKQLIGVLGDKEEAEKE